MSNKFPIPIIGYASGIAAQIEGCKGGPDAFIQGQRYLQLQQQSGQQFYLRSLFYPSTKKISALEKVQIICEDAAKDTAYLTKQAQRFVTLGGDHAYAVGTWSGVSVAKRQEGAVGLLWIDAHMDSHTFETSESGAIHGMPLAALLGEGDVKLTQILDTQPKLLPEYTALVGIRSFEHGEQKNLEKLGVRIFYMDEILQRGLSVVMQEAFHIVSKAPAGYGISIDLDALDPKDAPGVGSLEENGIRLIELTQALKNITQLQSPLALDIMEFNPELDKNHQTENAIGDLMEAVF